MQDAIVSTYKNLPDSETATFGYRVLEKMEGNPNFPDPPAALATMKKLLPELQSALGNAKGRDIEDVALKNSKKAELVALLAELAAYVTLTSNGNRLKILSSGFFISGGNGNEPAPVITQLEVMLGAPGEASLNVKRLRGARIYMHEYTSQPPTEETVWHSEISKFPYHTYSGLTSMTKYWFRVVAISREGQKVTSPVVTKVIQ
jgi:hypothetical protein